MFEGRNVSRPAALPVPPQNTENYLEPIQTNDIVYNDKLFLRGVVCGLLRTLLGMQGAML